jgi:hypothetical protein
MLIVIFYLKIAFSDMFLFFIVIFYLKIAFSDMFLFFIVIFYLKIAFSDMFLFSIVIFYLKITFSSKNVIFNSNMTSFFRFVNKRAIYRLGIISLAHAPVHVTDFPVVNVHFLFSIVIFYLKITFSDTIFVFHCYTLFKK